MQCGAMEFCDDFMPSGGEDEFASGEEHMEDLLELTGEEDDDEVQFVPPGGTPLAAASASAASSASQAPAAALAKQQRKRGGRGTAPEPNGTDEAGSKRKLVRLESNPKPTSPVAQQMLCVVGYPLKNPVPVHPVKVDPQGKQWVILNEHQAWMRRATAQAGTTHYEAHFQAAVTALREEIGKLIAEARKNETAEGQQNLIRKNLCLSDSEDEPCSRKFSKKRDTCQTDFEVQFRGVAIRVLNQVRPLCVECTAPAVSAIVAALKEKAAEHTAAPPQAMASAAAKKKRKEVEQATGAPATKQATEALVTKQAAEAPTVKIAGASGQKAFSMKTLSAGIPGKVTWQPSVPCWAVHYKQGTNTQVTRVRVKTAGSVKKAIFGTQKRETDPGVLASLREEAFRDACQLWNEMDTTKRPRIELEESNAL